MIKTPRLILAYLYVGLVALFGFFVCLLRPFSTKNAHFFSNLIGYGGLKILGIKLEVENSDRLDKHRPCLFIANHQDNLDIFPLGAINPAASVTLGKKSLLYVPVFGVFYWLTGNILINRKKRAKAMRSMDQVAHAVTQKNVSLWIFPEGTRNPKPGLLSFKKGAFYTAIKAQCPLVPVCVSPYLDQLDLNKLHSGTIRISILAPIETKGMDSSHVQELSDKARVLMSEELNKLSY